MRHGVKESRERATLPASNGMQTSFSGRKKSQKELPDKKEEGEISDSYNKKVRLEQRGDVPSLGVKKSFFSSWRGDKLRPFITRRGSKNEKTSTLRRPAGHKL